VKAEREIFVKNAAAFLARLKLLITPLENPTGLTTVDPGASKLNESPAKILLQKVSEFARLLDEMLELVTMWFRMRSERQQKKSDSEDGTEVRESSFETWRAPLDATYDRIEQFRQEIGHTYVELAENARIQFPSSGLDQCIEHASRITMALVDGFVKNTARPRGLEYLLLEGAFMAYRFYGQKQRLQELLELLEPIEG
jgi:hypothetical protein